MAFMLRLPLYICSDQQFCLHNFDKLLEYGHIMSNLIVTVEHGEDPFTKHVYSTSIVRSLVLYLEGKVIRQSLSIADNDVILHNSFYVTTPILYMFRSTILSTQF